MCLSTLNWQSMFRFQVQTVDDAKNYEEKNVGRAIENARKTK